MTSIKFLICLWIMSVCMGQTFIKNATAEDPIPVIEVNLKETNDECLKQMQGILKTNII